jgi:hypothetical protein
MNLIAPALCLIAQASFHPFFRFFLLLLDVSRISVHIYISNLDLIVNRRASIYPHFVLPPIVHFLILPISIFSLNIGMPCSIVGLIDRAYRSLCHHVM